MKRQWKREERKGNSHKRKKREKNINERKLGRKERIAKKGWCNETSDWNTGKEPKWKNIREEKRTGKKTN